MAILWGLVDMYKFMIATFLMLGWGFYEMSGGADFEPERVAFADTAAEPESPLVEQIVVEQDVAPAPLIGLIQTQETDAVVTPVALQVEPVAEEPEQSAETEVVAALTDALQEATPATLTFEPVDTTPAADVVDLRAVAGTRVNMRTGPGTDFSVLATLPRGTEAEVLEVDVTGWARIRIIGSGQIGWMAERLLAQL